MGPFTVGDVIIVSFPYADLTRLKKRPALIVGKAEFNNLIVCQITSNAHTSKRAIPLTSGDFDNGSLQIDSFIRPDKLFTLESSIIENTVGTLQTGKREAVKTALRQLFT